MICISIKKHIAARRKFMINANRNEFNSTEKRRTYRLMPSLSLPARRFTFLMFITDLKIALNQFRKSLQMIFLLSFLVFRSVRNINHSSPRRNREKIAIWSPFADDIVFLLGHYAMNMNDGWRAGFHHLQIAYVPARLKNDTGLLRLRADIFSRIFSL
jgi:hypothetical protein